jgi:oligoendopeptidase F
MLTIQQKCEELEKSIETQVIPLMPKINQLNKEFIQASIDNENLRIKLWVT